MQFMVVGLGAIICGLLVASTSDTPDTWALSEVVGLILVACGVLAVLIGMVTHVLQINSEDRQKRTSS